MALPDNPTPYRASEYDTNVRRTIPFYEAIHRQVVDLVRVVRPDVACWLDTGCGSGFMVETALPLFPATCFVLADPSEAMLQQARGRLEGVSRERVSFLPPVSSEELATCLGEVTPQVITAILCHHYLRGPQRHAAVLACYQVLARGGLFITFENVRPCTPEGTRIGLELWKQYQLKQGRSRSTVEAHLQRFGERYFPISVEDHRDLLASVGFQTAEMFWFSQMQAGFYAIK